MIYSVLEYCTLNSIYPALFDLALTSTFSLPTGSIIRKVWNYIGLFGNNDHHFAVRNRLDHQYRGQFGLFDDFEWVWLS